MPHITQDEECIWTEENSAKKKTLRLIEENVIEAEERIIENGFLQQVWQCNNIVLFVPLIKIKFNVQTHQLLTWDCLTNDVDISPPCKNLAAICRTIKICKCKQKQKKRKKVQPNVYYCLIHYHKDTGEFVVSKFLGWSQIEGFFHEMFKIYFSQRDRD